MKQFLHKYWWEIILIIVIIFGTPLLLNKLILRPKRFAIVGDGSDWLMFWGTYLGSIISALVAFFVLFKQLKQNHAENEENRATNAQENEKNRIQQYNRLMYEQETKRLDTLKSTCIDLLAAHSDNNLIFLINSMWYDPNKALFIVKDLISKSYESHSKFDFAIEENKPSIINYVTSVITVYQSAILDIQNIITFRINHTEDSPIQEFGDYIKSCASENMQDLTRSNIAKQKSDINMKRLQYDIALDRVNQYQQVPKQLYKRLYNFIQSEQDRINKIIQY